jgi:peptidoglycan/xylan/chitin deacetylase (PgdA/CDA1 family)
MAKHRNPGRLTSRLIRIIGDKIAPGGKGDGRLCILNYHRVLQFADPFLESEPDIETFHWQMELLANCFNVMPLHEAVDCLARERMPPRAICISFDDGYRSVHDFALPILKKFALPATVFVTSGYIDGGNMWNDRIIEAVQHLPSGQLDLREIGLGTYSLKHTANRKLTAKRLNQISKYLPPEARGALTRKLEELVGSDARDELMLTRKMIVNLAQHGIEIGAHTVTHPILTTLADEDARREITVAKQQLEAITERPVRLFAYPNGKHSTDFNERHVAMAREAGFSAAFTTATGAATAKHDRFQLPRGRPWDSTPTRFGFRLLRWLAR